MQYGKLKEHENEEGEIVRARAGSVKGQATESRPLKLPLIKFEASAFPTQATQQFSLNVVVPVIEHEVAKLQILLDEISDQTIRAMRGEVVDRPHIDFSSLRTIHYARWVLIPADPQGGTPSQLCFSTNFDGPQGTRVGNRAALESHFGELLSKARSAIDKIYSHCVAYPGSSASDKEIMDYLCHPSRMPKTAAFYTGSQGRSRDQIFAEAMLRQRVNDLIARGQWSGKTASDVRDEIRQKLEEEIGKLPTFPPQPEMRVRILATSISALLLLLVPILIGLPVLRWKEKHDTSDLPDFGSKERKHIQWASQGENLFLQNQLTHLVPVRPGWFRQATLRLVLKTLNFLAYTNFNMGTLGGIPSIHFARWLHVDRGKRLLFYSNFDSSWESYLGDFVDQASSGLTGVWSNTQGYPPSELLLFAGSRNADAFKAWARHHQLPTAVWYSAYPNLSIENINDNTKVRRGLADPECMTAEHWVTLLGRGLPKDKDFLARLFPSSQETYRVANATLPLEQIQGIILRGYGHHQGARFLLLRVKNARKAREWLRSLNITHALLAQEKEKSVGAFINVAFSHRGLKALGLDNGCLNDFPRDFVEDSDTEYKARVLGDVDESGREHWSWGSGENRADIMLMIYERSDEAVEKLQKQHITVLSESGLEVITTLSTKLQHGRKEHFGFRDGIAQPVVAGSGRSEPEFNTVPAGEFLLGYEDAYGQVSHAPQTPGGFEFGRNGSYLVLRTLEQDVRGFWNWCSNEAAQAGSDPETLASKMMGRWPSGAPLVKYAEQDPRKDPTIPKSEYEDFDRFRYKSGDELGQRCPFGSHVRRSNPRDWGLSDDPKEAMKLSNRHRILRRGRAYGPPLVADFEPAKLVEVARQSPDQSPDQDAERGLQFICFNSNIERQFEFVQQQWCNNPKFAGGATEADPIVGWHRNPEEGAGESSFDIPQCPVHRRVQGLPRFVRTRGSGYFFMPSLEALEYLASLSSDSDDR